MWGVLSESYCPPFYIRVTLCYAFVWIHMIYDPIFIKDASYCLANLMIDPLPVEQSMMTSANGNIFRVPGLCEGKPPVDSPHKCQWRGALVFSLICAWINKWTNNREVCDLRRNCAHYDVTKMPGWRRRNWLVPNHYTAQRKYELFTYILERTEFYLLGFMFGCWNGKEPKIGVNWDG